MSAVTDLERKVQSLQDQLGDAKKSLYEARLTEFGLVPKVTILLHKGNEFLFSSAESFWNKEKPWASGWKRKKDGEWGKNPTRLYTGWSIKP